MVTGIVAKHHANGATYTTSHRIVSGIPADVAGTVRAAQDVAGANAVASHRLMHSSSAT